VVIFLAPCITDLMILPFVWSSDFVPPSGALEGSCRFFPLFWALLWASQGLCALHAGLAYPGKPLLDNGSNDHALCAPNTALRSWLGGLLVSVMFVAAYLFLTLSVALFPTTLPQHQVSPTRWIAIVLVVGIPVAGVLLRQWQLAVAPERTQWCDLLVRHLQVIAIPFSAAVVIGMLFAYDMGTGGCPDWSQPGYSRNGLQPPSDLHWPAGMDSTNPDTVARVVSICRLILAMSAAALWGSLVVAGVVLWQTEESTVRNYLKASLQESGYLRHAIASVSHGARGPLNAVVLSLSLLEAMEQKKRTMSFIMAGLGETEFKEASSHYRHSSSSEEPVGRLGGPTEALLSGASFVSGGALAPGSPQLQAKYHRSAGSDLSVAMLGAGAGSFSSIKGVPAGLQPSEAEAVAATEATFPRVPSTGSPVRPEFRQRHLLPPIVSEDRQGSGSHSSEGGGANLDTLSLLREIHAGILASKQKLDDLLLYEKTSGRFRADNVPWTWSRLDHAWRSRIRNAFVAGFQAASAKLTVACRPLGFPDQASPVMYSRGRTQSAAPRPVITGGGTSKSPTAPPSRGSTLIAKAMSSTPEAAPRRLIHDRSTSGQVLPEKRSPDRPSGPRPSDQSETNARNPGVIDGLVEGLEGWEVFLDHDRLLAACVSAVAESLECIRLRDPYREDEAKVELRMTLVPSREAGKSAGRSSSPTRSDFRGWRRRNQVVPLSRELTTKELLEMDSIPLRSPEEPVDAPATSQPMRALLQVEIADSGCGYPAESVLNGSLFTPFSRLREGDGDASHLGSATLGLAVIKSIVNKNLGGNVGLASEIGAGTTLFLAVPVWARWVGEEEGGATSSSTQPLDARRQETEAAPSESSTSRHNAERLQAMGNGVVAAEPIIVPSGHLGSVEHDVTAKSNSMSSSNAKGRNNRLISSDTSDMTGARFPGRFSTGEGSDVAPIVSGMAVVASGFHRSGPVGSGDQDMTRLQEDLSIAEQERGISPVTGSAVTGKRRSLEHPPIWVHPDLPLPTGSPSGHPPRPRRRRSSQSNDVLGFLADDDAVSRSLLARFLRRLGCVIEQFSDGVSCLEALRSRIAHGEPLPRFVITDLHMSGGNGDVLLGAIRELSSPGERAIFTVLLSGDTDPPCGRLADACLVKPVATELLRDILEAIIRL
jgi:CheY-like chemotaxis protein